MAFKRIRHNKSYGLQNSLQSLAPEPILSQRAPTTADIAEIGSVWVDQPNNAWYVLTSVVANSASWVGQSSGTGTFTAVTVDPGDVTVVTGNVDIQTGTLAVAGTTTLANVNVVGNLAVTGDFDITDTASIGLTSTNNAAGAITLTANGGASETILIRSLQGTGADSLNLTSSAGGITLTSNLATADGINLNAVGGGIDVDAGLQINIASSQNAANAIVVNASAGGINITNTGTAGEDIDLASTGASINLIASEAVGDAIVLNASNAAGGVDIISGTGGMDLTTTGDFDLVTGTGAINIGTDAANKVLTIGNVSALTAVIIQSGNNGIGFSSTGTIIAAAAGAVTINSTGGALSMGNDADAQAINIGTGAAARTITIGNATGATALDFNSGSGGVTIDSPAGISIDGATASNFTVTGAGQDLTLSSVGGSVLIESTEDAALAIRLHANGGISETIQIHSDQGTGVGSINLLSDVGGITLTATGLASADAINLEATAGGIDMDAALQINIASSQNAANAIVINASAGGIDITNTGTAGEDIDLISSGASVRIISTEAASDAIQLNASDAAGGITHVSGTGGISYTTTGAFAVSTATGAINIGTDAVAKTVTVGSVTGAAATVIQSGTGDVTVVSTDAVLIDGKGVVELNSSGGIISIGNDAVAQNINIGTGAAARTITIGNATGATSVVIDAGTGAVNIGSNAVAHTTTVGSTTGAATTTLQAGTGGLALSAAGAVSMVPATATEASPTATVVINARVFKATFTGFTTAAAGTQAFTITNSTLGAGDGVMLTVANRGSNDAQMSLRRVNTETAGTIVVNTINNGAAALNGDVVITGWVID